MSLHAEPIPESERESRLLTDVSREARTSLDVILGYTEILREEMHDEGGFFKELKRIEQAASQLVTQVQLLESMVEREQRRREVVESLRTLHRNLGGRDQLVEGILKLVLALTGASKAELVLPEDRQVVRCSEAGCGKPEPLGEERFLEGAHVLPIRSQQSCILWLVGPDKSLLSPISDLLSDEVGILLDNSRLLSHTRKLAETDGLTGILNRRAFLSASQELAQSQRKGEGFAVAVLDVDHFKKVNDTWGHGVGDEVLVAVARRCGNALRGMDVLGRLGGEEFAIALPRVGGMEEALRIAERIRMLVGSSGVATSQGVVPVTVSIGVACTHDDAMLLPLIEQADTALYTAKKSGRNRVCT